MNQELLRTTVGEVLEVEPSTLAETTVLEEVPGYDSLKVLTLMVALDEIGLSVAQSEVGKLRTYGDIVALSVR